MSRTYANWHADFDALFLKPQPHRPNRREGLQLLGLSVVIIVLVVACAWWPNMRDAGWFSSQSLSGEESQLQYQPLAKLPAKGAKRAPLTVTIARQTVTFSNGYQLRFDPAVLTFSQSRQKLVSAPGQKQVLLSAQLGQKQAETATATFYANLADYTIKDKKGTRPEVKAFAERPVGQAKTGFVFNVPQHNPYGTDYAEVAWYVDFPDGSGLVVQVVADDDYTISKLQANSTFTEFQQALGRHYQVLKGSLHLELYKKL